MASLWASGSVDRIAVVSEELGRRLVSMGWIRRFETVWNGVDLTEFSSEGGPGPWRERLGVSEPGLLVGHVGRFDAVKRQHDLLDAARRLEGHDPRLHFVFVGQGPNLDGFRREAASVSDRNR